MSVLVALALMITSVMASGSAMASTVFDQAPAAMSEDCQLPPPGQHPKSSQSKCCVTGCLASMLPEDVRTPDPGVGPSLPSAAPTRPFSGIVTEVEIPPPRMA